MTDPATTNMIAFSRYIVSSPYDDDFEILFAKQEAIANYAEMANMKPGLEGFTENHGTKHAWRGYLPRISKKNEADTWKLIKTIVDNALERYPTSLKKDK